MVTISRIGLDIAKDVFQVHAVDANEQVVIRRKIKRSDLLSFFEKLEPCIVGMEVCGSAQHWARALTALGHTVRLVPAAFVRPFVKSQKNDAADAEAICEAISRPNMRFIPIKSADQQAVLALHRVRDVLVRQRTGLINALRGFVAEFGHVEHMGKSGSNALLSLVENKNIGFIPKIARTALIQLAKEIRRVNKEAEEMKRQIKIWHRRNPASVRLETIPGIGAITASALVASIPDPSLFKSSRCFSAWLGLVPRQHSSGDKPRLGGITKRGDRSLRRLLTQGARVVFIRYKNGKCAVPKTVASLLERKPYKVAIVALANRMARIVWALLNKGGTYIPPSALTVFRAA